MLESVFDKVSRLQPCKFIKKRLPHRCLFSCESCEIFKNTYFGEYLGQTALQNPSRNIAKQQEEEIQFESESLKSKLTLHQLIIFTFADINGCEIIPFSNLLFSYRLC